MNTKRDRAHAQALRRRADEARAASKAADTVLENAREAATAALKAAGVAEEAAHGAELVVLKLPGGLHGEPSTLVGEILSGLEFVAEACSSVVNPRWLASLTMSCKQMRAGFEAELQALREKRRASVALCQKVGQPIVEVGEGGFVEWSGKALTDSDVLAIGHLARSGALSKLTHLGLPGNAIGDAGVRTLSEALANGGLGNLTKLWLSRNMIGDAGVSALVGACASGALARLRQLYLGKYLRSVSTRRS